MTAPLPLDGIRVVSVEQAVSAPFCTRQFADLGAEVIKVERPGGGDFARDYDSAMRGMSAYFAWLNRGKRSVVLDLTRSEERERLHELVRGADVFVQNLAPGAIERLGFGYDALSRELPSLVWVGISGYGPDGPYRDRKAYDLLIQAEAGIVSMTGTPDEPAKVGISIADIGAGMYAYSSALAALYRRQRTRTGDRIDISMFECMTEWMMPPLYTYLGSGRVLERTGMRHNMIVPYGAYPCADGSVLFSIQNDAEFRRFCEAVLQEPSLTDAAEYRNPEARLAHREALERRIIATFASLSVQDVVARLERGDIAVAVMNDVAAVAAHPQLAARGRWTTVSSPVGEIPALLPPHNLASVRPAMGRVPSLGQATGGDASASRDQERG